MLQGYSVLLADPDDEPGPTARRASGAVAGGPHQALSHIGTVNHFNDLTECVARLAPSMTSKWGAWPGMCLHRLACARERRTSAWLRGRPAGCALTGAGDRHMILIIIMDKDSYI